MKCGFCDLEATRYDQLFVGTRPGEREGTVKWDYFNKPVHTCDNHLISHSRWNMREEPLTLNSFDPDHLNIG